MKPGDIIITKEAFFLPKIYHGQKGKINKLLSQDKKGEYFVSIVLDDEHHTAMVLRETEFEIINSPEQKGLTTNKK